MNDLYGGELRLWLNLFLPSVKLVKKCAWARKCDECMTGPRTPFERVRACPQADPELVARLEELRKRLDPFQLARTIERKLEGIYRWANRRWSPKPVPEAASRQPARRGNGCGKGGPKAPLEIAERFPLSHSHGDDGGLSSVTFQMSRRSPLRLHS